MLLYISVASESFANGQSYSIGAEVGLLTGRNIRIIGEDYADIEKESFGARVIVGVTADATRTFTGKLYRIFIPHFKKVKVYCFTSVHPMNIFHRIFLRYYVIRITEILSQVLYKSALPCDAFSDSSLNNFLFTLHIFTL